MLVSWNIAECQNILSAPLNTNHNFRIIRLYRIWIKHEREVWIIPNPQNIQIVTAARAENLTCVGPRVAWIAKNHFGEAGVPLGEQPREGKITRTDKYTENRAGIKTQTGR